MRWRPALPRPVAALWQASIWHPDAIPLDAAHRYVSPFKRVFLPLYDVVILWLGLAGLVQGFRAIGQALPGPGPTVLYVALAAAAIAALFGCAFPRLWKVEVAGKVVILALLAMIGITMVIAGLTIPHHTGITITPMVVGLSIPPLFKLWTLGREYGDRQTAEQESVS